MKRIAKGKRGRKTVKPKWEPSPTVGRGKANSVLGKLRREDIPDKELSKLTKAIKAALYGDRPSVALGDIVIALDYFKDATAGIYADDLYRHVESAADHLENVVMVLEPSGK